MKILLLKYRNIGDVLLITPLIENLRVFYPNATIDVSVNKGTESMLTLNPNLNKLIIYDRNFIKSLSFFKKTWKEFKFFFSFRSEKYDIVINLTKSDRGNLIALFSKASKRIGYTNSNWISRNAITHQLPGQALRHTIETNLDPLRILNIPIISKRVKIFWDEKDSVLAENILPLPKRYIHIHPLSRWKFKCIADSTMANIIDYCEKIIGIKTVITSSDEKTEIDTTLNPDYRYIQSMGGHKVKLVFTDLVSIQEKLEGKAINRVTVDLKTIEDNNYASHEKLFLVREKNDGKIVFLTDFTIEGESHFGGELIDGIYSFNITRYFVQLLNNPEYTDKLYILSSGAAANANRTILDYSEIDINIVFTEI